MDANGRSDSSMEISRAELGHSKKEPLELGVGGVQLALKSSMMGVPKEARLPEFSVDRSICDKRRLGRGSNPQIGEAPLIRPRKGK
jgi:hypothetical protein